MVLADDNGKYLDVNQAACELFGYSREQMLTMNIADLMTLQTPGSAEQYQAYLRAGRQTGEFTFVRADKQIRIASYSACLLAPDEHLSILHDITSHKTAATQQCFLAEASDLLASSLDYQTTLQSVARLVVPHLADWCVVHLLDANGALELVTVMHVDPAKVEAAQESSRRYPPRMDASTSKGVAAVLRSGKAEWIEDITEEMIRAAAYDEEHYRLLATSGMTSYLCVPLVARSKILGTITFVGAESGHRYTAESLVVAQELARRAAIAVDNARLYAEAQNEIAERQRAETALQESRDYYRTLTEALPQLVWTTGPDGVADYFNPRWFTYTGQDPNQTERRGNVHHADLAHTLASWNMAVQTGDPYEVEYRIKRADGEYRWFLARGSPLKNAQGEIIKWFGTCTDIDAQKKAEIEIAALNSRLRRSVQETHHRVKNNLQIISALVELQVKETQTTVPVTALTRIGRHTRSLAAIHDLLTEESKTDAHVDFITTKAALNKLLPLLQATTGGRPIRSKVEDFRLPVREGASLALLVTELVSNAVKYSRNEIEVALTVRSESARLEVCDDGPGFPPDFDWRKAASTGLGLIDSTGRYDLRGIISYKNRNGGGAHVTVEFPVP